MDNSKSVNAAVGSGETQLGPETVPNDSVFSGANSSPGNLFGDASSRTPDSAGGSLAMGLSSCEKFNSTTPDQLGEGRDDATGKPDGPQRGPVSNGGASAKLQWG